MKRKQKIQVKGWVTRAERDLLVRLSGQLGMKYGGMLPTGQLLSAIARSELQIWAGQNVLVLPADDSDDSE